VLHIKQNTAIKSFFLVQVLSFLVLLFIARGLPAAESFRVALLLAAQTYVGLTIWKQLIKNIDRTIIELLAAGFAIGSILFTIIDQATLYSNLKINDFAIHGVLVLGTLFIDLTRKKPPTASLVDPQDFRALIVVAICVFLGFGELTHGPLLAVAVLGITWIIFVNQPTSLVNTAIVTCTSLGVALLAFFTVKPPIAYGSWFLRPLFTKTDDAVFSESVAYSLSAFGTSNYAAAAGTDLRYHWFSLAWSGLVQRSASVSPFGMTLHVVPVVSFLVIAMLLIAIGGRLGLKQRHLFVAPIVLFCSSSVPESLYFYSVINTSNVMTYIWSLSFLLVFVLYSKNLMRLSTLILSVLASVVLLSKMPYTVALLGGLAISSAYIFLTNKQMRKSLTVQLAAIGLTLVTVFALFLTPHSWEKRSYILDWNLMNIAVGSQFRVPVAIFFISILLLTRFPILLGFSKDKDENIAKMFILGAVSSGIIRFIVNGNSAEAYFLNSALIFGSLGIALAINGLVQMEYRFSTWETLGLGACSGLMSFTFIEIWNSSNFQNGRLWQSRLQILVPFIIAALTCAVAIAIRRKSLGTNLLRTTLFLFVIYLVGANMGIYVLQSSKLPTYTPRGSIAADVDLESLIWLRNNSDESDVIATNRFLCPGTKPCDFDESSFLISAVAHRQVLIEGPRFVAGGRPYPIWITERMLLSRSFADSPSNENFRQLRNFGVSWFYLDAQFLPRYVNIEAMPWRQWTTVAYHNSNVYILKLKE
jgi:hypothetical protein